MLLIIFSFKVLFLIPKSKIYYSQQNYNTYMEKINYIVNYLLKIINPIISFLI